MSAFNYLLASLLMLFTAEINATKVIYLPQAHSTQYCMSENIEESQINIFNYLSNYLKTGNNRDNVLIFAEDLFYNIRDGKITRSAPPKRLDNEDILDYVKKHGATMGLAIEGFKSILQPSIFKGVGSAHLDADNAMKNHYQKMQKLKDYIDNPNFNEANFNAQQGDILENFRKISVDIIHFQREKEMIELLAKSIKEHPEKVHVLIYGASHEFSKYLENVPGIEFEIPRGFKEAPCPATSPSAAEYQELFSTYKNPLRDNKLQ